jgi:hypothetical protein
MAIEKAKVVIKGIRPLLIHCFTQETLSLQKRSRTGVAGNDPEEWKRTFLCTSEGQLYLNSSYILGCLKNASKYTKSGRASIQPKVMASLQTSNDIILFNRNMPENHEDIINHTQEDSVYLDVRSVVNPATKGRNIRYRVALSPGWETEFEITWENTIISLAEMESVVYDAGSLVGLADGRNIGFGRFEIIEFNPQY